jgi:hypothetical protein
MKDIHKVCGVRAKPLFDAIPLAHYITLILHLTIGKGNNVLDNYVAKLQAAAEGFTDEYYTAEKEEAKATKVYWQAKDEMAQFNMLNLEYKKELKQQMRRNNLSDEDWLIVEIEMVDIIAEQTPLQGAVPRTKADLAQAKIQFAAKKKNPENGKAFRKPINARMD